MPSELLTTGEAAARLGWSVDTVAAACDSGQIPSHRTPGRHRRIPSDAIERIIAERDDSGEAA